MDISRDARIYVAGHRGLVGSAIWRELQRRGFTRLIGRAHAELDLLDAAAVRKFYAQEKPEYVLDAAAKVGGIRANDQHPAEFLFQNLQIQNNLIHGAYQAGVRKLLFLGSSCIYPRLAPQPLKEEYLMTGPLEPTNEWYAVAKIAGIRMCQAYRRQHGCDFISAMPTNLYGPNDNYDLQNSHVLPALIRKFHEAKAAHAPTVTCWGTGSPLREFLYADDLARACVFLLENYSEEQFINVGSGSEVTRARPGREREADRRVRGRHRLGHDQTGRHAAQADGRLAPVRAGLAAASGYGDRHSPRLRGLPEAMRMRAVRAGVSSSSAAAWWAWPPRTNCRCAALRRA